MKAILLKSLLEKIVRYDHEPEKDSYAELFFLENELSAMKFSKLKTQSDISHLTRVSLESVKPSLQNANHQVLLELRRLTYSNESLALVGEWAEKLLRFCEIFRNDLRTKLSNYGVKKPEDQRFLLTHVTVFLLDYYRLSKDLRFLNFALKVLDIPFIFSKKRFLHHLQSQQKQGRAQAKMLFRLFLISECSLNYLVNGRFGYLGEVIVLSPSKYSLLSTAVTEYLLLNRVVVNGIVIRKLFSFSRLLQEYKRDGFHLINKIRFKLLMRNKKPAAVLTVQDFITEKKLNAKSVLDLRKIFKVPLLFCQNYSDLHVTSFFETTKKDCVVFTGGGIIRQNILSRAGSGVINCHFGILPKYRGLDVMEWAQLHNEHGQVGLTVHFMADGIDTGDIFYSKNCPVLNSLWETNQSLGYYGAKELSYACLEFLKGKIKTIPQLVEDGKQYFYMHEDLQRLIDTDITRNMPLNT